MESYSTAPQANDMALRHVVMYEYYDTLNSSSALEMWYLNPASRRGNITRKQREFQTSFVKLLSLTRHISQMAGMEEKATEIDKWYAKPANPEKEHYLEGISLFKEWAKALFEQKIVEFR